MSEMLKVKHRIEDIVENEIASIHINHQFYIIHIKDFLTGDEIKSISQEYPIYRIYGRDSTNQYELSVYLHRETVKLS